MRRVRRSRVNKQRNQVVNRLVSMASHDQVIVEALAEGNRKKAFGRLLNKWMDSVTQESVIDRYVDQDALEVTSYALNIINKRLEQLSLELE